MVNISWKDQYVLLAIRDCVPLTITVTAWHTIDRDAINALRKNVASNCQWLGGNQPATRKKPPVTGVVLNQNTQLSCWCIMWTAICTIPMQAI